jgi:hypothetical protein
MYKNLISIKNADDIRREYIKKLNYYKKIMNIKNYPNISNHLYSSMCYCFKCRMIRDDFKYKILVLNDKHKFGINIPKSKINIINKGINHSKSL